MWGWRGQGLWQLLHFTLLYLLKGQVPRLHQKIQRSSICLKTQRLRIFRNIGMNSSLLIAHLPKIMISVDVSSQVTPSVIAGPNNRWFILHPVEHADKYHKLKETELSWKRPAPTENQSPPPADIVVKKKCTNTLVTKSWSARNLQKLQSNGI